MKPCDDDEEVQNNIETYKVVELKKHLKNRGEKTSGTKSVLKQRLREYFQRMNTQQDNAKETQEDNDDDNYDNDDDNDNNDTNNRSSNVNTTSSLP